MAGEHLVELGHKRVGFLGGPPDCVDSRARLVGLEEVFAGQGLEVNPAHAVHLPTYLAEDAVSYARRWLSLPRQKAPTAVVCANDDIALGLMRALLERGVRIPEEISIIGFDGLRESGLMWPGLTTVTQPLNQSGRLAVIHILEQLEAPDAPRPPPLEVPMELLIRESTGPAPSRRGRSA